MRKSMWKVGLALLVVLVVVPSAQWLTHERGLLPEAADSLESDEAVTVLDRPWLTFVPSGRDPDSGLVFYPGGRIAPEGYAPLLKAIAAEGYLVAVPDMPLNMAPFHPNVADRIIAQHPEVARWAIGGHSVGGTMAARYAHAHRDAVAGLVIWASYPAGNADLSDSEMPVALIYGTLDPRVNDDSVDQRRDLLPANAIFVRIEGGDHHQFGAYEIGPQDQHATIDRETQHQQIIRATLTLLEAAGNFAGD